MPGKISDNEFKDAPKPDALAILKKRYNPNGRIVQLAIAMLSEDDEILMVFPMSLEDAQLFSIELQETINNIKGN